jgi:hypothetical protein
MVAVRLKLPVMGFWKIREDTVSVIAREGECPHEPERNRSLPPSPPIARNKGVVSPPGSGVLRAPRRFPFPRRRLAGAPDTRIGTTIIGKCKAFTGDFNQTSHLNGGGKLAKSPHEKA